MKIEGFPINSTDWSKITPTEHPGETGMALWRTLEIGNVRVRIVEYSPGYKADHWCSRGHVIQVLEGELMTELKDGRVITTPAGCGYQVQENGEAHRSFTSANTGAKLFIVD